jgi:hypothetical protein
VLAHAQYVAHDEPLSERTVLSHDARFSGHHLLNHNWKIFLQFYNSDLLHFTFYILPLNTSVYTQFTFSIIRVLPPALHRTENNGAADRLAREGTWGLESVADTLRMIETFYKPKSLE